MERAVLIICTGNFCRSPMAEAILKDLMRQYGEEDKFEVQSAGTWTQDGLRASSLAVQAMKELGLDISAHRSHHLTPEDVGAARLIIVMARDHKEALAIEFPQAREKLRMLSEMAGKRHDIEDPSGTGSLEMHRACAREIRELLKEAYPRIVEFVTSNVH